MTPNREILLLWGLLAFAAAYQFLSELRAVPSIGQLAQPAAHIAFGVFLSMALKRKMSFWHAAIVFGGVFVPMWFSVLVEGLLAPLMIYGLVAFLVLWRVRQKYPFSLALIGCVSVGVLYNPVHFYRAYTWTDPSFASMSLPSKLNHAVGLTIYDLVGWRVPGLTIDLQPSAKTIANPAPVYLIQRVAHIAHLARAQAVTPDQRPYWEGRSYAALLTSFVPRLFWENKPTEVLGGVFARDYWQEENPWMSMNLPWLPELYLNFGAVGAVIGMGVFGTLFGVLDRVFNRTDATEAEAMTGLVVLMPFVYPDSNFSVMMGSMLPLVVVLWVYFFIGAKIPLPPFLRLRRPT